MYTLLLYISTIFLPVCTGVGRVSFILYIFFVQKSVKYFGKLLFDILLSPKMALAFGKTYWFYIYIEKEKEERFVQRAVLWGI